MNTPAAAAKRIRDSWTGVAELCAWLDAHVGPEHAAARRPAVLIAHVVGPDTSRERIVIRDRQGSVEVVSSVTSMRRNPMRKKFAIALATGVAAATVGFGSASTVSAAPKNAGAACVQDGIGFLKTNGLLQAAAKKQIDYSTLGPNGAGLIRVQLPANSFLPLGQVVKLHTTNPELFTWCD
jgi:hypothetical protein